MTTFTYQPPDQDGVRVTTVSHVAPGVANQLTRYIYDSEGRLKAFENPLHPDNDVLWEWKGSGATRTDRLDRLTDAQGASTDPTFDDDGRVASVSLPNPATGMPATGTPVSVEYCGAGDPRVRSTTDSGGLRTEYRYAATGEDACPAGVFVPATVTVAANTGAATETTVTSTSQHGLVTSTTDEDQVTTSYTWDFRRRLLLSVTVDDDTGVSGVQTTEFGYDPSGRLRVQRSPVGDETWWTYDGGGRVLVEHSPVQVATKTWSCTAATASCSLGSPPSTVGVSYGYWLDGTLKTRTDESGNVRSYERSFEELPSTLNTAFNVAEPTDGWVEVEVAPDDDDGTARDINVASYDAAGNLISERVGDSAETASGPAAETTWTYDAMGRVTSERSPEGVLTFYRYDRTNRLTATVSGVEEADAADPDESHTRRTVYDYRGRVTEVFGPAGDVDHTGASAREHTRYSYDNADRVTEIIEGDGASARRQWMRYDAAGRLRYEITDVDRDNDAPDETDPAAWDDHDRVIEHRYTDAGRPAEILRPPVDVTEFQWGQAPTAEVQTVAVTAIDGTWQLRVNGQATAALDHDATAAQVEAVIGGLGDLDDGDVEVTAATPSDTNTVVHVLTWHPEAGNVAEPTADGTDLDGSAPGVTPPVVSEVEIGTTTEGLSPRINRYGYDDAGRQISADTALSPPATTSYWPDGRVKRQTTPGGSFEEYAYDPGGRVIATTTPSPTGTGTVTATTTYTARGELATTTDPYPTGGTAPPLAAYTYWPDGNLRTAADQRAHAIAGAEQNTHAVVTYDYDGRDNRTRVTSQALSSSTDTTHTPMVRRFTYNVDDQPLTEQRVALADSHLAAEVRGVATHAYDATTGRRTGTVYDTSGADREVDYEVYWNSGQVRKATSSRGTAPTVTVEEWFDSFGQRTRMTGPGGTADYTWDGAGNMVGFTTPGPQGLAYERTWDLDHHSTGIVYNPGHANREYKFRTTHEPSGRIRRTDVFVPQIEAWWPVAEYTFDPDGNPRRQVVNSVVGTRTWGYPTNGAAEASGYVQDRASGAGDITQGLGWRPDGRLATSSYNAGTIGVGGPPPSSEFTGTYGYDPAGQLTSRSVTGDGYETSTTYSYDAMGHRLSEATSTTAGGQTTDDDVYYRWHSDRDTLLSTGSSPSAAEVQYSWDFDGTLSLVADVSGSGAVHLSEFSYDARGLPLEFREGPDDTLAATRTYDGDGRLAQIDVEGGATYDLSWDPTMDVPQVLEAYTGSNTWSRLVYGDERVGYGFLLDGAQVAHGTYGYDHQGSTITTPDATAPVGYDPFGTAIGPPAGDLFFGYRGELHVGDTIHLRNRDYDPTLGIFTSPDPVDGRPGTPTANAVYPYANNDPTNNVDPLGLFVPPAVAAPVAAPAILGCFANPVCAGAAAFVIVGTALLASSASTSPPRAIDLPDIDINFGSRTTPSTSSSTSITGPPVTFDLDNDDCDAPQTTAGEPCEGMLVYRVYGPSAGSGEFGASWTPIDPRSIGREQYRDRAGLPDSNPGTHLVIGELKVPNAARSRPGGALPCVPPYCAEERPGGLPEYMIENNPVAVVNRTYATLSPPY